VVDGQTERLEVGGAGGRRVGHHPFRTVPCLPILPTTPARMTHDYVRHGTTSLFAAYDVTGGSVIAQSYRRRRHRRRRRRQEFLRFLKVIDAAVPKDLDLRLVLDNHAARLPRPAGGKAGCDRWSSSVLVMAATVSLTLMLPVSITGTLVPVHSALLAWNRLIKSSSRRLRPLRSALRSRQVARLGSRITR
jgi:hypothetical protein